MAHSISRRQFLQGSGAAALSVAAAGLLSSCLLYTSDAADEL